jgi:hypothetical protein
VSVTSLINKILAQLTNKTLTSLEHNSITINTLNTKLNKPLHNSTDILFGNTPNKTTYTPFFSKNISSLHKNLSLVKPSSNLNTTNNSNFINNLGSIKLLTLKIKTPFSERIYTETSLTQNEAYYIGSTNLINFKIKNVQVTLNDLYKTFMTPLCPTTFNFNVENNLNIAKQQRWLVKNSLLTESIIPNSFLITQSKKLIGSGVLDKDFTNKTLWLPTKSSKLSSMESLTYFNNLSNQLFKNSLGKKYLNTNSLEHPDFNNLNFFENSRLWLFKKYFFNNNQNLNLIVDSPQINLIPRDYQNNNTNANVSFYSVYNYYSKLSPLFTNNFTPSLLLNQNTSIINSYGSVHNQTSNLSTTLVTPNLDILSSSNINFMSNLTSNPQQTYTNNTNYFNLTTFCKKTDISNISYKSNIKFYTN